MLKQLSERVSRLIGIAIGVVKHKPLMRAVIAGVSIIPVGGFFLELAIHHRQPHGMAMAIVLFSLSIIVVWTWLQGWFRKAMLVIIPISFTISISFVDYSKLTSGNQEEKEERVRQVIDRSFRENRDYLDERFGRIEDMLQELTRATNE